MNAMLPMRLPRQWDWLEERDERDWLEAYQAASTAAELAAEGVRAACEAFKAGQTQHSATAYAVADRAYDAARLRFQVDSAAIVGGVRAIAGIARHMQLAAASERARLL